MIFQIPLLTGLNCPIIRGLAIVLNVQSLPRITAYLKERLSSLTGSGSHRNLSSSVSPTDTSYVNTACYVNKCTDNDVFADVKVVDVDSEV